jgi:hypothetical protein
MSPRVGRQLLLLGLAASLWSAIGEPSFLAFVGAYAVGWAACELPPVRGLIREAQPVALLLLAAALAAPGVAFGYRARAELVQNEGLLGAATRFRDRWRMQSSPSIAPPVFAVDRPQTFFVQTDGTTSLSLRAGGVRPIKGDALGHGLFRLDYDPRRDGVPATKESSVSIALVADGRSHERILHLVRPLAHPRWFCVSPDRSRAAAPSEESDELFVLTAAGLEQRIATGDGPVDCAFIDATRIAVTHRNEPTLRVYDLTASASAIPASVSLGARQGRLALSPTGALLAVILLGDTPSIALLQVPGLAVVRHLGLRHAADWIAFGAQDDTLLVATRTDAAIHRFHAGSEDAKLELGRPVVSLGRSDDGQQIWVATTDLHAAGHQQLGNHFVQDQLLTIDTATLSMTGRRFTAERSERQSKPGDVDRGLSPMGVHAGLSGSLWIAFAGSDEVWQIGSSATARQIDLGAVGLYAPHGIVELSDRTLLVSSPVSGAFGIFAPGSTTPRTVRVSPSDDWLLAHDRDQLAQRVGERGFYEGTRSGISCQSCHMHADSDDAAYNLGDHRLLPTLSVRGIADTPPYLRDGSYPRIRDLDEVAQTLYRGYLRNQAARGETIESFLRSLPRRDNPRFSNERDRAAERRGLDAFVKAQCNRCHQPPAFTNLAQLPLRFLFPDQAERLTDEEVVDTPSLLSVAASAPYLNDGRAASLADVLVAENSKNRHGDVRSLTAAERADLIAFLRSL